MALTKISIIPDIVHDRFIAHLVGLYHEHHNFITVFSRWFILPTCYSM